MNKGSVLLAVVGLSLTASCSGTIVMSPLQPSEVWDQSSTGPARHDVEGVIVYLPVQLTEVDELTEIDSVVDGKSVPSPNCHHVYARKLVAVPDWRHPWLLNYKSKLLETHTFSMQTSNGMLISINSQSTPDQGKTFENVAAGLVSPATIPPRLALLGRSAPITTGKRKPAPRNCTITPRFVAYETPPDIKPFGTTEPPTTEPPRN